MGVLIHLPSRFDPTKREVYTVDRSMTVRRLVQKHRGLRSHTQVYRPGGIYGRRKVREFALPTVCLFNGKPLTRSQWKCTTVGANDIVAFYRPPTGGGFNPLSIVLAVVTIAIAVAAPYIGGPLALGLGFAAGSFGAAAVTAGVGLALSVAAYGLMSLFVQPAGKSSTGTGYASSTPASSPTYNLTAQGNYARLQQPIPEAFGRNRMYPDFVTTPYATYDDAGALVSSSTDQYLHHIVGLGIGEYEIDESSLKLGDTPITNYPDITWAKIEPGGLSDPSIADERWITSQDLADIELLDAAESSPWAGPYAANPAGTTISLIEIDMANPRGLWAYNPVSTGLDGRAVTFEVQAQQIDDLGLPVGDPDTWETFDPTSYLRTSQDPQRVTTSIMPSAAGRYQVRLRRTDAKDTSLQAGHQLDWIGLRGRVVGRRTFSNMTCIAIRMKAGEALNAAQSRTFNLVATRKLEAWDAGAGAMTMTKRATRSPCDAFAYIARSSNGGRLRDDQIALAELYANHNDFADLGWTFDFVFDSGLTVSDALGRIASAVVAERVTQGGKVHLVRDVPVAAPVAMFSPRNITPGSFSKQYLPVDSTAPDCLIGTYIDQKVWQPVDVTVAFDDSAQERPSRMTLYGIGARDQARAVLWNLARGDRYRRSVTGWSTAMEGLAVTFGDGISFSHDVPNYGQTLEVIDCDDSDPNAPVFTLVDPPDFSTAGATYFAAVRDGRGRKAGPFVATAVAGQSMQLTLAVPDPDQLPEILIGGDKERTWLQLGPGETYAKALKVKQVTPRDSASADIVALDDDPRMYDPLPDEPETPIGGDTSPITIAITNDDGPLVILRSLANAHDYTGLA
ncbi:MAG: host specificity factor TipJ family phage tail protein, partial [Mycobacterium sp.]